MFMNKCKVVSSVVAAFIICSHFSFDVSAQAKKHVQNNIKVEVTSTKKIENSSELKFIKSNINELMEILFNEKNELDRFDKLTKFVHKAFDTTTMGKYALSGVYRLQKQSTECMNRLEEKVVKYLCKTYSDVTKDYKNIGKIRIDISNVLEVKSASIARGSVKFDGKDWPITINFKKNRDKAIDDIKPFNMVFNNISVINPSAFVSLFLETKKDINEFEKRLDKLIAQ